MLYKLCKIELLKDRKVLKFEINGVDDVAVVSIDGRISAFTNVCPHKRMSSFADGLLEGEIVYCPHHSQAYNVFTGERQGGGATIKTYQTIIEKGNLFVEIPEEKPSWSAGL